MSIDLKGKVLMHVFESLNSSLVMINFNIVLSLPETHLYWTTRLHS